jgi:hypothetical protein
MAIPTSPSVGHVFSWFHASSPASTSAPASGSCDHFDVGQKMKYVDQHHKRTDFTADSFSSDAIGRERSVSFIGSGQHQSIILSERGSTIVAIVPEAGCEFVVRKVQMFEKLKWLTLDFENNLLLHRILIHIDFLEADELDLVLKSLIAERPLPYYRV